jgi:hypothetical protein
VILPPLPAWDAARSHTSPALTTDPSACNGSPAGSRAPCSLHKQPSPLILHWCSRARQPSPARRQHPGAARNTQRLLPPHHHRPPLAPAAVRKTWANYVRSISPQGGGRIGWTGLQCCTSVPDLRRSRSSATTDHNKERILLGTRFPRPRAVMERRHMQIHRAMNRKPSGGARRGRRGRWGLEDEGARVPAQEQLPVTRVDSSPLCQRDPVN